MAMKASSTLQKMQANLAREQGYLLQIQGLQLASTQTVDAAKRNILKTRLEHSMALEDAARKFEQLSSSQRASAGASGLDVYSVSFQNVYAEAADAYTRDIARSKNIQKLNEETMMTDALRQAESYLITIGGIKSQKSLDEATNDYR